MESFGGSGFNMIAAVTKKRSSSRRPRSSPQQFLESCTVSPVSDNAESSGNASKESSESGSSDAGIQRKEYNLNSSTLNTSSVNRIGGPTSSKIIGKDDVPTRGHDGNSGNGNLGGGLYGSSEHGKSRIDLKRSGKVKEISEIIPRSLDNIAKAASHNLPQQGGTSNGSAENRPRKVKLKVGGITHTLHAKCNVDFTTDSGFSKPPRSTDAPRHKHKHIDKDNSGDVHFPKEQWDKDSLSVEGASGKQNTKTLSTAFFESVRKSKRVPKKRVLDGASDEEEDDEIRYLERLKRSKAGASHLIKPESDQWDNKKNLKVNKNRKAGYEEDDDFDLTRRSKEAKMKPRSDRDSEDTENAEGEEEHVSDTGLNSKRRTDELLISMDGRREISLTSRQRALQSSRDGTGGNGTNMVEFPDGLPPAPPRKQKEKLSEVEQQLKKAEAAQRRRLQVEKAARESEAEAIRKILGQDSSRKKREDKMRKKRDELAKERATNSMTLAPNMVRCVMGPTGTTVIFPESIGLPSIFNSPPCRYQLLHFTSAHVRREEITWRKWGRIAMKERGSRHQRSCFSANLWRRRWVALQAHQRSHSPPMMVLGLILLTMSWHVLPRHCREFQDHF